MKTDLLNKILKFIDHERGKVIGIILAVVIVLGAWGCDIKLQSPLTGKKVTQELFNVEVMSAKAKIDAVMTQAGIDMAALLANQDITNEEFAKWNELRNGLFDIGAGVVTTIATGGAVNPTQVIASLVGVGGILGAAGGWYDSKRKNAVIEKNKT